MIDCLMNTFLFEDLEYTDLERITQFCSQLELDDGDILISENELDYDLYVLCEGYVEIISTGARNLSGEVVISKQDKNVFGEISWLTNCKRTATLRCRGDVVAIRIDGDKLMAYLDSHSQAGFTVMRRAARLLGERLEDTNNLLKQILWNTNI